MGLASKLASASGITPGSSANVDSQPSAPPYGQQPTTSQSASSGPYQASGQQQPPSQHSDYPSGQQQTPSQYSNYPSQNSPQTYPRPPGQQQSLLDSHQAPLSYESTYGTSRPQYQNASSQSPTQGHPQYGHSQNTTHGNQPNPGHFGDQKASYSGNQYPNLVNQSFSSGGNSAVSKKIEQILFERKLQTFYPAHKLQPVVTRASAIDYNQIGRAWKFPTLELAIDFAPLSMFDVAILADNSGSLAFEENGDRIEDLKMVVAKTTEIATLFDDDGIVVRVLNGNEQANGVRSVEEASRFISALRYAGTTPLGTALQDKILKPFVYDQIARGTMEKPVLIIIVTDGVPTDGNAFERNIRSVVDYTSRSRYGTGAIAIQVAQVGKDENARKFLAKLDNDPVIGPFIDCTSYFELEQEEMRHKGVDLTPELWLLKMMVGAIDKSYDEMDE